MRTGRPHGPEDAPAALRRLMQGGLAAGLAGACLCVVAAIVDQKEFFEAYLIAWWFFLGISLGGLVSLMVHELTGGRWGRHLQSPLQSAVRSLPLLAVLFIPLVFGIDHLYPWVRPDAAGTAGPAADVQHFRQAYLQRPFFLARAALYWLAWLLLAAFFSGRWRRKAEAGIAASAATSAAHRTDRALKRASVVGLIVYAVTITLASIDWIMSLSSDWYSTTFGLLSGTGQSLSGFAFGILGATVLPRIGATRRASQEEFQDLGNLLLMFVMLWAYLAFMQYLIIWSEDLQHENSWYLPRATTSWKWVGLFLIVCQFALPFVILLFREAKRCSAIMLALAAGLLAVHWIDDVWMISPTLHSAGLHLNWSLVPALAACGGLWLANVARELRRDLRKTAHG